MSNRSRPVRRARARVAGVACFASLTTSAAALLVASTARADRYVVVYRNPEYVEPEQAFNLGFDAEGVVPTSTPRFLSGNTLSGGSGFKIRFGDRIRLPGLRITPEGGYAFDHLFASDDSGNSFDWDMHRFFGGVRLTFGRVVTPGFYAHIGWGWRDTGDPTVPHADGLAFDAGFVLDIHVIRHVGLGAHVEYTSIDAQPFTPQWVALGLHADITF
jgi:hypothetical protein